MVPSTQHVWNVSPALSILSLRRSSATRSRKKMLSLSPTCPSGSNTITANASNSYSWMWLANRDNYIEGGDCQFWLEFRTFTGDIFAPGSANNFSSGSFGVDKRVPGEPTLINGYKVTSTALFAPSSEALISASVDWICTGEYSCRPLSTSTASTTTHQSSTTAQPASISIAPPISTGPALPVSTRTPESQSGLSAATKVGIGVGVPLCASVSVICTWALLLFLYRRRLRRRACDHENPVEARPNSTFWVHRSKTLESTSTAGTGFVAEVEGSQPVAELMGTPCCELP